MGLVLLHPKAHCILTVSVQIYNTNSCFVFVLLLGFVGLIVVSSSKKSRSISSLDTWLHYPLLISYSLLRYYPQRPTSHCLRDHIHVAPTQPFRFRFPVRFRLRRSTGRLLYYSSNTEEGAHRLRRVLLSLAQVCALYLICSGWSRICPARRHNSLPWLCYATGRGHGYLSTAYQAVPRILHVWATARVVPRSHFTSARFSFFRSTLEDDKLLTSRPLMVVQ